MARLELPENEKNLAESLDSEMGAAETEMYHTQVGHRIIDGYLRGARRFNVMDRSQGRVQVGYEHLRGDIMYRHEDIVRRYQIECGRWLRSDISPVVTRAGVSLGDMRSAAIGNAVLNARLSTVDLRGLRTRLIVPYVKYGIVGVGHYEMEDPLHPDHIEVVPANQLRGIPAFVEGIGNLQGVARKRHVEYNWLKKRVKDMYGVNLDRYNIENELKGQRVMWGASPPGSTVMNDGHGTLTGFAKGKMNNAGNIAPLETSIGRMHREAGARDDPSKDGRYYVPMEEIYPYQDDQLYAARYILKVGRIIIFQEDFEGTRQRVVCPLQVARYTDTGAMFSRGFVAPLIPANDQVEKMIASVARNIRDMDSFGTLMVSGGMQIDLKNWNKLGPRPRAQKYNIDPLAPHAEPKNLTPVNTGLMPVRFAEFMQTVVESLAGQGPFYDGKAAGRVDSAAGHGFLFNTGNVGLGLPSHNLADALSAIYGRVLQVARSGLKEGETIKLATIDENLAGVVFDPKTGKASLTENPVPNPWEVRVDVKDRTPSDPDFKKRELAEHATSGLLGATPEETYLQYWITVYEENLEVIGGPKEIFETWRKVIWQIILLFNDGETPGPMEFGELTQNPMVQLMALRRFMNKIEFSLASDEIQREFELWYRALERLGPGGVHPEGMPLPEDSAAQALPELEAQIGAPPGGPGIPGGEGTQLAEMGAGGAF